ncbi:C45 family autoproteolytic acyltransferase/hydolase [Halalkalibacillus halophilus]|uniref:C45 family autoproteolytic acyltransferase/hydolase n=1 Tax=Halalkalibacillus halophilus TaxID=392827 RepID=UPI0004066A96|nr:C45 family autoproteolytic acyltransferase/hydolase [Halalkalibacillus halophilus]
MKQVHSEILTFKGTHFDFGKYNGEQLKKSLTTYNRKKHWKIRRPRFQIDVKEAEKQFKQFVPAMWDEILGLSEGLQQPLEEVLKDYGGYRVEIDRSGCSVMMEPTFMIRNYDYQPQTYEGRFSLFQPTDAGFASIGPSSRITGRMDGMNEKGLAMAYNFTHRKSPESGFVCYMIGRMILNSCSSVEEAIDLLKEIPHRNAFSYMVMDTTGKRYVIEAGPRGVAAREATVCTNHYEILTAENRNHLGDSHKRMETIENNRYTGISGEEAFRMLNDTDGGVFSKKYKGWAGTIHTSAYFPQELQVWFAIGGDQTPRVFDFKKWLAGESISSKYIYGEVDTTLPFAHMD